MEELDTPSPITIVGCPNVQNNLLREFLESRMGHACRLVERVPTTWDAFEDRPHLLLVDFGFLSRDGIEAQIAPLTALLKPPFVALVNVRSCDQLDSLLDWSPIRGFFLENTTQEQLIKGIKAILKGDYWFSRRLLARHLERHRQGPRLAQQAMPCLTPKEMQILELVADGFTNEQIAKRLCVSIHTVKTHVYNIFRKINVKNRVQAIKWVKDCGLDFSQPSGIAHID